MKIEEQEREKFEILESEKKKKQQLKASLDQHKEEKAKTE